MRSFRLFRSRGRRIPTHTVPMLVGTGLLISMLLLLPSTVGAQDDDRATVGEWIVLAIILIGAVSVVVIVPVLWRRDANPHTGLPSKIKRRRARGPLRKTK
jgi:hypothetical protein